MKAWVETWCTNTLGDPDLKKRFGGIVQNRLTRGKAAMDLALLAKLATIRDKPFTNQADLDLWYAANAIPENVRKEVAKGIPTTQPEADDVILCLSANDGKTLWKKSYPG